ncbi:hypothetical protein [Sinomicrobium weinanense]|uniref:Uncharacterized protein n=1 Tax=Sinomicrobium weinanense TaxID=2842200 RepID=A0A926Q400_9FLAO|nr:hypothetical protein [Sinomicrobium weinanense]MBC9798098.1 hypothetical protein [Sinomicrobium weinanense]MBU3125836.1 hypothetical protein [Sinomicrobium weinanense]
MKTPFYLTPRIVAVGAVAMIFLVFACEENLRDTDPGAGEMSISVLASDSELEVFPDVTYQYMDMYGTDNKLCVGSYLRAIRNGNTAFKDSLVQYLFTDIQHDVLRIPIRQWLHTEGGTTLNTMDSIYSDLDSVLTYLTVDKPGLAYFASPAETSTPDEYPDWLFRTPGDKTTFKHYAYGQLVGEYLNYLQSKGYNIQYLGLYNEDSFVKPQHIRYCKNGLESVIGSAAMDQLTFVGPDRWGIYWMVDWLNNHFIGSDYMDELDVIGTHFYDDGEEGNDNNTSSWTDFATAMNSVNKPSWFTESNRFNLGTGMDGLTAGLDHIWDPIKKGKVNGVISYWGSLWILKQNFSTGKPMRDKEYYGYKKFVNTSKGKQQVRAYGGPNVRLMAFRDGSRLVIMILNRSTIDFEGVTIKINDGYQIDRSLTRTRWTPGSAVEGDTTTWTPPDSTTLTQPVPAKSFIVFTMDII